MTPSVLGENSNTVTPPSFSTSADTSKVENDGGVTVFEFSPNTLGVNLSADSGQAPVVSVNEDGDRITFGSVGYTGTYTAQINVTDSGGDKLGVTAWIGDTQKPNATDTTNGTVQVTEELVITWCPKESLQTQCRALADSSGDPAGKLKIVDVLVNWNDTGEINGSDTSKLSVVDLLVAWNDAR